MGKKLFFVHLFFLLVTFNAFSQQSVPIQIPYSGKLKSVSGEPVNGKVKLTFKIYTQDEGGEPIWTEVFDEVNISDGKFKVILGINTPLSSSIFMNSELYLGITVNDNEEMAPRTRILSVPYSIVSGTSYMALDSEKLGGYEADNFMMKTDTIDWTKIENIPEDIKDGDNDTTYSAGEGLKLQNTTFLIDKDLLDSWYVNTGEKNSIDQNMIKDGAIGISKLGDMFCNDGEILKWDDINLSWKCSPDFDTTYTAGNGLKLENNTFSVNKEIFDQWYVGKGEKDSISTQMLISGSVTNDKIQSVSWEKLTDVPEGFKDGIDNDTLYDAGKGIKLSGTTFSLDEDYISGAAYDSRFVNEGQEGSINSLMIEDGTIQFSDISPNNCTAGQIMKLDANNQKWICADDNNTTYQAGNGLNLSGTTFSLASSYLSGAAYDSRFVNEGQANSITSLMIKDSTITSADIKDGSISFSDIGTNSCKANQIMKRSSDGTKWVCAKDSNTTYSAGNGLTLTGTTFSLSSSYLSGAAYDSRFVNEGQGNSITSSMIKDGNVTSADIKDGTIMNSDIAYNAEISPSKINGGSFQDEAYTFPNNVNINGTLALKNSPILSGCPSGMTLISTYKLCYSGWYKANFQDLQALCAQKFGGHICTYSEYYILWDHIPLFKGDFIGNRVGDDQVLCFNSTTDKNNFEGVCNKNDVKYSRCCFSLTGIQ